jgi:hypothetical protein
MFFFVLIDVSILLISTSYLGYTGTSNNYVIELYYRSIAEAKQSLDDQLHTTIKVSSRY